VKESLTLSTSYPLDPNPPKKEHGGMVVDMKECYLVLLLAKDEEDSVKELHKLGEVIPP